MPAVRTDRQAAFFLPLSGQKDLVSVDSPISMIVKPVEGVAVQCLADNMPEQKDLKIYYPITSTERSTYRTKDGKKVPPHHWDVYDFIFTIPVGKVTTYKDVCLAIGGSPRSVGGALRHNPFDPYIPCHRVIASSLFIGGFSGEWGKDSKTKTQCNRKLNLLEEEGVSFTQSGYLGDPERSLWKV